MKKTFMHRFTGALYAVFGLALLLYVAAWLAGKIAWSRDIAFLLMAGLGLISLFAGCKRLITGRPLICFKTKLFNAAFRVLFCTGLAAALLIQGLILTGVLYPNKNTTETPGCVVIMGAKIYGDTPSSMLAARVDAAAAFLKANPAAAAIACGGFPEGSATSEAQVIRNRLVQAGIDPARITLDESSPDTLQSAANAHTILLESGYSGSVAIATSDYHLYRCMRHFRLLGYEVTGITSSVLLPLRPVAHFREMISLLRDYVYSSLRLWQ